MPAAAQGRTCLNCGTLLTDTFCAHCGQRAGDVHLSVRDLAHEVAAEHFGLDTKVARTLETLVRYPGRLTVEFLSGRRIRYLPPFRLYLSLSLLFFLCSAITNSVSGSKHNASSVIRFDVSGTKNKSDRIISFDTTVAHQASTKTAPDSVAIQPGSINGIEIDTLHGNAVTLFFKRRYDRRVAYLQSHKNEAPARIAESFQHDLPDALFLLIPGLALALLALYRGTNRYYAEHLVFALHFQAFGFAALTIGLIPIPFLDVITGIAILAYLFLALRTVYGQSTAATTGKFVVIVIGYGIPLTAIMAAAGLVAFLFA